jgi:hypothetical protein
MEVWRVYFVQRKGAIVGRRGRPSSASAGCGRARQALILPSVDRFLVLFDQVAHPDQRVGAKRTTTNVFEKVTVKVGQACRPVGGDHWP